MPSGTHGYFKSSHKAGDFPEANVVVVLDTDGDQLRIYSGPLDGSPKALPALACALTARGLAAASNNAVEAVVSAAVPDIGPVDVTMHAVTVSCANQQSSGTFGVVSRSGLAQEVGRLLVEIFVANLDNRLRSDRAIGGSASPAPLKVGGLLGALVTYRFRRLFDQRFD